jgi:hypothetical protein
MGPGRWEARAITFRCKVPSTTQKPPSGADLEGMPESIRASYPVRIYSDDSSFSLTVVAGTLRLIFLSYALLGARDAELGAEIANGTVRTPDWTASRLRQHPVAGMAVIEIAKWSSSISLCR